MFFAKLNLFGVPKGGADPGVVRADLLLTLFSTLETLADDLYVGRSRPSAFEPERNLSPRTTLAVDA